MELRVVRTTDRFDDVCAFYGDVLGWPVTKEWDDHGRGRIFGYGDAARVELLEADDGTEVDAPRGIFLSVEVDDVQALHDRLLAAGAEPHGELTDQPWGHRSFPVTDPAGLVIVFFQCI
jgi:uncharacterized glyoxalase superfamily protein PhnB